MIESLTDLFALLNDTLQAVIIIFGTAVVLYHVGRGLRDRVTTAFCALITFVLIVYLSELMASRIIASVSAETWLRAQWVGIAMVPAAQFHLSDALLSVTGAPPRRRKFFTPATYFLGVIFFGLVLFSNLIVNEVVLAPRAPHLKTGPLFPVFAVYFWGITVASISNVWRARRRCITRTTRQRMTSTLIAFLAAPLGVFPYLLIGGGAVDRGIPFWVWPVIIIGNLVVGAMFGILTAHLAYFGATSPDRVVRVRLFKFMARVPLAGSIVLLVYVLVSRSDPVLGIPIETMLGASMVLTVMLVEWAIHTYKRPLERFFQLNDDPDVRRIQQLGERLLTTSDLRQFLESVLAATCEALRTPTSFVAAITADGPKLESVVGPLADSDTILQNADWRRWIQPESNGQEEASESLQTVDNFIIWHDYWIQPLYNRRGDLMLGIFGIRARSDEPDLDTREKTLFAQLTLQAAAALEDRILQQEVFALVGGLLPQIMALQERRSAATFGGLPVLTTGDSSKKLVDDPEFNTMVWDALKHYWGGPQLTQSPLMRLEIVQQSLEENENNPTKALRAILDRAIELQKPEGERKMTTAEWILYNILELKFVQGLKVRDVARRLAISDSDLYRKQRVAIENVAQAIANMEKAASNGQEEANSVNQVASK